MWLETKDISLHVIYELLICAIVVVNIITTTTTVDGVVKFVLALDDNIPPLTRVNPSSVQENLTLKSLISVMP